MQAASLLHYVTKDELFHTKMHTTKYKMREVPVTVV